jgi:sugar fermentation stimulation protein A
MCSSVNTSLKRHGFHREKPCAKDLIANFLKEATVAAHEKTLIRCGVSTDLGCFMEPFYRFPELLTEAVIKSRPNRFIMEVEVDGTVVPCHCPSTGRIGDIIFKDVPCLLSIAKNSSRKTRWTVEAISLEPLDKEEKSWIGINQTMANKYLEHFIRNGLFSDMLGAVKDLKREVKLGKSRIDFRVGDTFLEVKSPLTEVPFSPNIGHRQLPAMTSFDRLIKHFCDLANAIDKGSRAIVLLCYQYDAPPFCPPPPDKTNEAIESAALSAEEEGVENWQVNLKIDKSGVSMLRYFRLKLFT